MGVWHTGDNEYLRTNIHVVSSIPLVKEYPCKRCNLVFTSREELFEHRFEKHPTYRPTLFLRGQELGTSRTLVTRSISATDVTLKMCDHAIINDESVDVTTVPSHLAQLSSDVCRLVLENKNVQAEYTLDFQIAEYADLIGIEKQFVRTVSGPGLDTRAVDEFISATSAYRSAIGYCDGICAYLYGVLAKERVPDSTLKYNEYTEKYNKSAEKLSVYERPLAKTISSIIEFHFNHFKNAKFMAGSERIGQAAARFSSLLDGSRPFSEIWKNTPATRNRLDASVTDWETEQIIRMTVSRKDYLTKNLPEMENLLERIETHYDSVKLHILLAEINAIAGNYKDALRHAKKLRNLPGLGRWATTSIHKYG